MEEQLARLVDSVYLQLAWGRRAGRRARVPRRLRVVLREPPVAEAVPRKGLPARHGARASLLLSSGLRGLSAAQPARGLRHSRGGDLPVHIRLVLPRRRPGYGERPSQHPSRLGAHRPAPRILRVLRRGCGEARHLGAARLPDVGAAALPVEAGRREPAHGGQQAQREQGELRACSAQHLEMRSVRRLVRLPGGASSAPSRCRPTR